MTNRQNAFAKGHADYPMEKVEIPFVDEPAYEATRPSWRVLHLPKGEGPFPV